MVTLSPRQLAEQPLRSGTVRAPPARVAQGRRRHRDRVTVTQYYYTVTGLTARPWAFGPLGLRPKRFRRASRDVTYLCVHEAGDGQILQP
jgi:hypothetical protein